MSAMQEPTTTGAVADGRGTSRRRTRLFVAALTVLAAVIGVVLVFTLTRKDETRNEAAVVATIKTSGPANWVTAGEDALWLSLLSGPNQSPGAGAALQRIDLATGNAGDGVSLDGVPLASIRVDDSLWVGVQPTSRIRSRARSSSSTGPRARSWAASRSTARSAVSPMATVRSGSRSCDRRRSTGSIRRREP